MQRNFSMILLDLSGLIVLCCLCIVVPIWMLSIPIAVIGYHCLKAIKNVLDSEQQQFEHMMDEIVFGDTLSSLPAIAYARDRWLLEEQ